MRPALSTTVLPVSVELAANEISELAVKLTLRVPPAAMLAPLSMYSESVAVSANVLVPASAAK